MEKPPTVELARKTKPSPAPQVKPPKRAAKIGEASIPGKSRVKKIISGRSMEPAREWRVTFLPRHIQLRMNNGILIIHWDMEGSMP